MPALKSLRVIDVLTVHWIEMLQTIVPRDARTGLRSCYVRVPLLPEGVSRSPKRTLLSRLLLLYLLASSTKGPSRTSRLRQLS